MYTILIALLIGAAAGGAWTALALWKTWQFGLVLFFLVSIVSFVVISRVTAKRVEPRFMDVQRMIQSGQTPLAIQTLEELMPLSNWQILLKGQIHAQIGLLAYASGDEGRAEEHLPRSGYRATEAQMALAALSYRKGRKDQAYEALDTAITAAKRHAYLHFVSIEKHPLMFDDWQHLRASRAREFPLYEALATHP